ncbi:MAG: HAMP domain-containing histidine kinase [Corynebacteriales bacterium]|nr:HAMP domain-containing histidine kinase [Mycobacteriales bacterium]
MKRWFTFARPISLRARLTLVYGGLFLIAGMVLLATTYVLFTQQLDRSGPTLVTKGKNTEAGDNPLSQAADNVTAKEAERWMQARQRELDAAATKFFITQGGLALILVGGAAAGFGWLITGRVLTPLHQVTATARRIASAPAADRGLHERIALRGPADEVKELADTFDTMVERLDRSFEGQRRFVANASHELRTPLTLGRALVEVAMHRKTACDDIKQLGEYLLEINSRHERLISGLLLLAGSENELADRAPVDLADIICHVMAQNAMEATEAKITMRVEAMEETPTLGNALLLERLIHNLLENAIRHNISSHGWVEVSSRVKNGEHVEVQVSNSGPELTDYQMPTLFEPFHRANTHLSRASKGAGLGLSIVRSIAHAHEGDVVIAPRQGGGLVATLTMPFHPEELNP